jgi:O-antigen/teichoic acid export membrane protein
MNGKNRPGFMVAKDTSRTAITITGTIWNYAGLISSKTIAFITTMILARILSQDDFGIAAYAGVITGFIDVIAGLGINNSLIFHKEKEGSNDTAFWINLVCNLVIFTATYFCAPLAGLLFNDDRAVPVLRVLSIIYPITALGYVHATLLQKRLQFSSRFIPLLVGSISKAVIAIPMALSGFGVWSIIISQIGGELFSTVAYWIVLRWKPAMKVNPSFIKPLLGYGLKSVFLDILNLIINQIDFVLVGRMLGSAALGIYSMAFRIPELLIQMLYSAVAKAVFPVFSSIQDDVENLRRGFLKMTRYLVMIVVPVGVGLSLVAEPVIRIFLSDKWLEAVPVIRAISIYSSLESFSYGAGLLYKAKGKQGILTAITLLQLLMVVPAIWWVTRTFGSIVYVAWTQVAINILVSAIDLAITVRIVQISFRSLLEVILPPCAAVAVMSLGVWGVLWATGDFSIWIQLISSIIVGVTIYGLFIYFFNYEVVLFIKNIIARVRRGINAYLSNH